MKTFFRFLLVTIGSVLFSLNINTFVHTAGLLPGGFTGITLLLQEVFAKFLGIKIPFAIFYWGLNIVPAIICFKYVGKKFTILSIWSIISVGFFTDIIPGLDVTNDILLCTIFGGIINGVAISLCLLAGATSGGTDFISICNFRTFVRLEPRALFNYFPVRRHTDFEHSLQTLPKIYAADYNRKT